MLKNLPTLKEIEAEQYKRSYYRFFKEAFKVLHPQEELRDNWHIEYLCNILQDRFEKVARHENKTKDLIICIPPRTLKSMIVTVLSTAWLWTKYPHVKFISASYSSDLAVEHTVKTRRILESEWYKERFGDSFKITTDQNEKSKYENDKSGDRRATSVGGTITGGGADIIICDDPLKVKEANSPIALEKAWEWWSQTMFSRLNNQNTGLRIVVMQRLNENDVVGRLLENNTDEYEIINIPAELTDKVFPIELREKYTDGLFFPKEFTLDVLSRARKSLGSAQYAGQYLQSPSPVEGNLIKKAWFQTFSPTDEFKHLTRYFRTDTAYGKEESDNSATICYSIYKEKCYIWNVWKANLPFPQFIKAYKNYVALNGYTGSSKCYFEPKATGISVIQTLKQDTGLNIIEGNSPSDAKETRITSASPVIEAGRISLLEFSPWIADFIDECAVFPNGKNDDQVDVLSAIINEEMVNVRSFAFAFG